MHKAQVGLALGSGAARGWAHIGALQALGELGIRPDVICGTSIGALVGGFHLSGRLEELSEWARALTRLRMVRFLDIRIAGNGMIAGNRVFAEIERSLGDIMIEDLAVPFAGIATDLNTGHEVWLNEGSLATAIRASFSLPGLFEPVLVDDRWVIDGALVNPVPVSVCHALGAQVVIAINLNGMPVRNGKSPIPETVAGTVNALPGLNGGRLRSKGLRFIGGRGKKESAEPEAPGLVGVLASTLNLVQDRVTRSRLAADPPEVNITPKVGHISPLDFYAATECIAAGATAVYQAEADLRDALALFEEFA